MANRRNPAPPYESIHPLRTPRTPSNKHQEGSPASSHNHENVVHKKGTEPPDNIVTNINDIEYKGKKRSKGGEFPEGDIIEAL
jgi:hypothetical protein